MGQVHGLQLLCNLVKGHLAGYVVVEQKPQGVYCLPAGFLFGGTYSNI